MLLKNSVGKPAYYLKHVMSKDFIFKKSVQGTGTVSAKDE